MVPPARSRATAMPRPAEIEVEEWAKPLPGLDAVNEIAEAFRGSSVEIHHFGEMKDPPAATLRCHGVYDNELLPTLLRRAGINVDNVKIACFIFCSTLAAVAGRVPAEAVTAVGRRAGPGTTSARRLVEQHGA